MELAENFFSQKSVIARKRSVTPFFGEKRPLSPPPKKTASAAKPILACFYKTLTMGARRSCGQFYHVMEVSCYHSFWVVTSRLCLRLLLWGLLLICTSRHSVEVRSMLNLSASTSMSASQSCLRIHLACLTAVKSNLFGPQDCLKRCRGGHQGELIYVLPTEQELIPEY